MENVKDILDNLNFEYKISKNQSGLFTKYHKKFDVIISRKYYTSKHVNFEYQCNAESKPTLSDCLSSCIRDGLSYNDSKSYKNDDITDLKNFMNDFGYTNEKGAIDVYIACKDAWNSLLKVFTYAEIIALNDYFMDLGY